MPLFAARRVNNYYNVKFITDSHRPYRIRVLFGYAYHFLYFCMKLWRPFAGGKNFIDSQKRLSEVCLKTMTRLLIPSALFLTLFSAKGYFNFFLLTKSLATNVCQFKASDKDTCRKAGHFLRILAKKFISQTFIENYSKYRVRNFRNTGNQVLFMLCSSTF